MDDRFDIAGKQFGHWTVIKRYDKPGAPGRHWHCQCKCGREKILSGTELRLGRTLSCKRCVDRRTGHNTITIAGEVGVCQVASGDDFLFDSEDSGIVSQYLWHLDNHGYVRSRIHGKSILLHRMLIKPPDHLQVDHINRNPRDNRKSNLRVATNQENVSNQSLDKTNSSGFKGVTWHKMRNKWAAQIHVHGKHISLGLHQYKEDAARAYNRAASFYFGEFACLNTIES